MKPNIGEREKKKEKEKKKKKKKKREKKLPVFSLLFAEIVSYLFEQTLEYSCFCLEVVTK